MNDNDTYPSFTGIHNCFHSRLSYMQTWLNHTILKRLSHFLRILTMYTSDAFCKNTFIDDERKDVVELQWNSKNLYVTIFEYDISIRKGYKVTKDMLEDMPDCTVTQRMTNIGDIIHYPLFKKYFL